MSDLPQYHVVGFTGHRQLRNSGEVAGAIARELAVLREAAPGEWIALSSAAVGSDTRFY